LCARAPKHRRERQPVCRTPRARLRGGERELRALEAERRARALGLRARQRPALAAQLGLGRRGRQVQPHALGQDVLGRQRGEVQVARARIRARARGHARRARLARRPGRSGCERQSPGPRARPVRSRPPAPAASPAARA